MISKILALEALIGTIRAHLPVPVRNVSDITPEQHSHEIINAIGLLSDKGKQLAEARAEIERLKNEHENSLDKAKNYTLELSGATTKQAGELADKDRQLTEARAEIERLQEWEYCMQTQSPYMAAGATWEQRHKRDQEVIAERDKLIEQMREALKLASLYIPDNATDAIRISEAALSAAERGKV